MCSASAVPTTRSCSVRCNEHVDGSLSATYGWRRDPDRVAGELYLLPEGNAIRRIDVYPLPNGPVDPRSAGDPRAARRPGTARPLPPLPGARQARLVVDRAGRRSRRIRGRCRRRSGASSSKSSVALPGRAIGPCIWTRSHTFVWRDRVFRPARALPPRRAREAPFEPVPRVHDEGVGGHRWWSLDELRVARERSSPAAPAHAPRDPAPRRAAPKAIEVE